MKPVELEISAFGSFGGCEKIRFDNVQQGIFLVTGDTGAGKTTIFDAIMYALYGKTSGGRREGSMMRSHFAKDGQITYVKYTFRNRGNVYTVYRQPEQIRTSKRRRKDGQYGTTKEGAKVCLTLPDGTDFTGKGRETDAKLCEIIGLDAEQFTQIAMIAQGDFLRLLLASSRERREIFARIFDTQVCEQVQTALEQRYKAVYGQLEDSRKLCEHDVDAVRLPEQSVYAQRWEEQGKLSGNDNAQLMELLESIQEELVQREKSVQEQKRSNDCAIQKLQQQIADADRHNNMLKELLCAKTHFMKCEEQSVQCEKIQERIDIGKRAASVCTYETEMKQKRQKLSEMQEKMQRIADEMTHIESETSKLQEQKSKAQKKYASDGSKSLEQAACLERTLSAYENCEKKEKLWKEKEEGLRHVLAKEKEAVSRRQKFMEQSAVVQRGMEERSSAQKEYYRLKEKEQESNTRLELLCAVWNRKDCMERLEADVLEKRSSYMEADEAYRSASADYEDKNHIFLDAQAGIMAQRLSEGEPCPVCGSTHHPKLTHVPAEVLKQSDVDKAAQLREQADKTRQEASEASAQAGNRLKQEEALVWADMRRLGYSGEDVDAKEDGRSGNDKGTVAVSAMVPWEGVQKQKEDEQHILSQIIRQAQIMKKRMEEYEKLQEQNKKLQTSLRQTEEECASKAEEKMKLQVEVETLQNEVQALRRELVYASASEAGQEVARLRKYAADLQSASERASEVLEKHFAELASLKGQLTNGNQQIDSMTAEVTGAEHMFGIKMKEAGFTHMDAYYAGLKEVSEVEKREEQLRNMQIDYIEAKTKLEALEKQAQGMERKPVEMQAMRGEEKHLAEQSGELDHMLKELYSIRSGNEKCISNIRHALNERVELEKRYGIISSLYKTANGKLTGAYARLNFQTYMQRIYFKKVVNEANKRLRVMSGQQFELRCRELESLGRQGEAGLDLDIYSFVTGQVRDVKTLSGGESFMAALAMALGMADIIQNAAGSVRLETMFIDEGFGTLDDDSRREAIRILDELAAGKQLIGIISHVTELKEQIPVRLHVKKNEQGSRVEWI